MLTIIQIDVFITLRIFKNSFQEISTYFIMDNSQKNKKIIESAAIQPGHWNVEEGICLIGTEQLAKDSSWLHPSAKRMA